MGDDGFVDPPQRVANHLDLAGVDEDQVVVTITRSEEVVALGDVLRRAEAAQPRPLRVREGRLQDGIGLGG